MKRTLAIAAVVACGFGYATFVATNGSMERVLFAPRALARPVALPFLWRNVVDATAHADPAEAYERARLLLAATPGWTDGHSVFAFRFALDGGALALPSQERAAAAKDRLLYALAALEEARATSGRREAALLVDMAWLIELAVRNEPGIAPLLSDNPALLSDRYLAQAEAIGGSRMVKEQRLYDVPRLCAALIRSGDLRSALHLLDEAAERCAKSGIQELAVEWRATLLGARRTLAGDPTVDPDERERQKADPRLEALAPFLR